MPIYEYQCRKCGHEFEREQRITEDPIKKCPACKSQQARRLISLTSFVLKGSGWYKDLYASPSAAKRDTSEDAAAKGEPKSDAKADAGAKGEAGSGTKGEAGSGTKGGSGSGAKGGSKSKKKSAA